MSSPQSLKNSVLYSLVGLGAPLISAVVSIPLLFRMLDNSRYGFISLTWIIVGYSSVLDLGLGRSLTKQVPVAVIQRGRVGVEAVIRKTVRIMCVFCVIGTALIIAFAGPLVGIFGVLPAPLQPQAFNSVLIIAAMIPALVLSSGYRGALEGLGRFKETGLIRAVSGSAMFLGPLFVAFFSNRLEWLTASLLITRYATAIFLHLSLKHHVSLLRLTTDAGASPPSARTLIREASWITVSNIVSPLLVYMDRFFVSRLLGIAIVPFYTIPYDIVTRLTILPEAVFAVLFPRMSTAHAQGRSELERVYSLSLRIMGVFMFLAALSLIVITPLLAATFIGPAHKHSSETVMSILLVGIFVNTCARPAYNALQASDRARATGILHLLEFPLYVILLLICTSHYGIVGTATAWLGRTVLDMTALTAIYENRLTWRGPKNPTLLVIAGASAALLSVSLIEDWTARAGVATLLGAIAIAASSRFLLNNEERAELARHAFAAVQRARALVTR